MQKVKITKPGDTFEGREGLAEVITGGVVVYFDGDPYYRLYNHGDFKVTGPASEYDATRLAYNQQRAIFPIMDLVRAVRRITGREYLMDASVTKRLRELRGDKDHIGRINYEYDSKNKKYKKLSHA